MALTTNQLVVGMFNMAAGGYTTLVSDYVTAHGNVAAAEQLLPVSGLNPQFMGTNLYSNADFASAVVGKVLSGVSTTIQSSIATIVSNYMTANPTLSRGAVVVAVLEAVLAVPTTDAALGSAVSAYTAKVALADASTSTSTDFTALAAVVGQQPTTTGQTFTLTTATDTISGTTGNDTIVGDWTATATINGSDQITGGAGTDTFKAYGALGSLPASMTGVEVVELMNAGTMTINTTTMGAGSEVNKLVIHQASAAAGTVTTTGHSNLTLRLATQNNGDGSAVTWAGNATDTAQTLELFGYAGATTATAAALTTTGAAVTTFNVKTDTAGNAITTLTAPTTATTVNIDAATALKIGTSFAATAAKTVNVSGAGKVTIAGSDFAATVTVDGTNNTGGLLYTAEAAGSTLTFKGGSGNDSVTFAAGTLTTADVLTGGTGTDTLIVNDTALSASGDLAAVNAATGFEVLGLGTTGASVNFANITNGINALKVGSGNISATTSNSLSTTTYTIDNSASNTGTVTIGNKAGETGTAVTVDYGTATAAKTLAALTLTGATGVSLVSTGTGTGGSNVITTLTNTENSTITITGAKDLTITNALTGASSGSVVNASAFTGKLSVIGTASGDTITGGTNDDTLNGGGGKDTINGGDGADTIYVRDATQADVLTGGAGADKFIFEGTATTMFARSNGTDDIVWIKDFVAGTDKIGLNDTATAFTGVTLTTQTITSAANLAAVWSAISPVGASTDNGNLNGVLVTVSGGGAAGTYLYVNDTNAAVSNALDLLVNVTGISGTLASTDFIFA